MGKETRYHLLDGIRGAAALAVVFYHLAMRIDLDAFRSGAPAVDLFFALSGFVLAKRYADQLANGITVRRFMARRLVRLEPLALIGAILGAVKMAGQIRAHDDGALSVTAFGVSAVFNGVMLPSPAASGMFPLNAAFWSLFGELVVNLIFAAWMFAAPTRHLMIVAGISLIILIGYTWPAAHLPTGDWAYLPGMLARAMFSFVVGMIFARVKGATQHPSSVRCIIILAAVFIITFPTVDQKWKAAYDLSAVFVLLALLFAALRVEVKGPLRALCTIMGDLSYPVYVIHYPLLGIGWAIAQRFGSNIWVFSILYIAFVLAISALLLRYYDRKARAIISRWLLAEHIPAPR